MFTRDRAIALTLTVALGLGIGLPAVAQEATEAEEPAETVSDVIEDVPEEGEVDLPEEGEVDVPDEGEVDVPDEDEVDVADEGEVAVPGKGEVAVPGEGEVAVPGEQPPASGEILWQAETGAVSGPGDNADDPAIWVNTSDPAASLVIGTNKAGSDGGLHVYGLDGREQQVIRLGDTDNVDIRSGLDLAGGTMDVVGASNRARNSIDLFAVGADGKLSPAGTIPIDVTIYGTCLYAPGGNQLFAFATSDSGVIEQYEVTAEGDSLTGAKVRSFDAGGVTEACVADDETGALYLSEEAVGSWRYGAAPDAGDERVAVDVTGSGNLQADVEGAAIYDTGKGTGYVLVSSQGDSTIAVYDRAGDNAYIGSFSVAGEDGDDVTETDGLDVTSVPLGDAYPQGLLVVHDHENAGASGSNFKLIGWDKVAAALGLEQGSSAVSPTVGPSPIIDPPRRAEETDTEITEGDVPLPEEEEAAVSTRVVTAP